MLLPHERHSMHEIQLVSVDLFNTLVDLSTGRHTLWHTILGESSTPARVEQAWTLTTQMLFTALDQLNAKEGRMEEYEQYDGLGLAALVRQGEVCPEELLEATIARIEAHDPLLNAVVTPMFDEARAAIRAGLPSGPFQGAPFLLKDLALAAVPGVRTRQGAVLFQDFIPKYEAEIVTRYRRAGLVFVGKTATPELGLAPTTESRLYGATRNPWDVAVAAGYVPAANASVGHVIEDWHYDLNWELVRDATRLVAATEVCVTLEQRAQALGRALHTAEVEPETWRLVELSRAMSASDYLRALHTLYTTGR